MIDPTYKSKEPPAPLITIQPSAFSKNMGWALGNEFASDVQFLCKDQVFYAHKVILHCCGCRAFMDIVQG